MSKLSQWFIKSAVIYVILGMLMGIAMGIKQDFTREPAHAHLNLIGWVSLALTGFYCNAVPAKAKWCVAHVRFRLSTIGVRGMMPGLILTLLLVPPPASRWLSWARRSR